MKHLINLNEWNTTYDEVCQWVLENDIDLYAIAVHGGNSVANKNYAFDKDEDFIAFKLKFARKPAEDTDAGYYYAPYVPIFK